jgi:hypothetical protein
MKQCYIVIIMFFTLVIVTPAQSTAVSGSLTVYSEDGSVLNAKNSSQQSIRYRISYVIEGRNSNKALVNSRQEQTDILTIGAGETQQVFVAPKDPERKITYRFKNIIITECVTSKEKTNARDINTRMNGGR